MKVILTADLQNVGLRGDIKEVSDGYARNFLIPRSFALEANDQNMKIYERQKVKIAKEREKAAADTSPL